MIGKPSVAKYFYNVESDKEASKLIATNGVEVVSVLITAGGSAAAARLYNASSSTIGLDQSNSILIAANTGESTPFTPSQPVKFDRGLYVVIEGGSAFGAEVFVQYN